MKISKTIVLGLFIVTLVALAVTSQISQVEIKNPNAYVGSIVSTLNNTKLSVEEKSDCIRTFYNKTEDVYDYVPRTKDTYGACFNVTNQSDYACVNGTEQYLSYEVVGSQVVLANSSACTPRSFVLSISENGKVEKKEIDFSDWGACIYNTENNCLTVTCQSIYDGANDGQFHGCKGGTSCQKFQICDNSIKIFYKNSRDKFVEQDPTFYLEKLTLKEVGK